MHLNVNLKQPCERYSSASQNTCNLGNLTKRLQVAHKNTPFPFLEAVLLIRLQTSQTPRIKACFLPENPSGSEGRDRKIPVAKKTGQSWIQPRQGSIPDGCSGIFKPWDQPPPQDQNTTYLASCKAAPIAGIPRTSVFSPGTIPTLLAGNNSDLAAEFSPFWLWPHSDFTHQSNRVKFNPSSPLHSYVNLPTEFLSL